MIAIEPFTKGRYNSIPIICGPTASGKSKLAFDLCLQTNGELCSMDSMQIYRHMDIGTAKPTLEEQKTVPHHLIDLIEPYENYSAALYKDEAISCIGNVLKRGCLPVFCGGTGQYALALSIGISYNPVTIDPLVTKEILLEAQRNGYESLYLELLAADPESAAKIHPNNRKRVIRALEIYRQTGKTMTYFNSQSLLDGPRYPFALFAIEWDRKTLYERMDLRVDRMMDEGLLKEVKSLLESGITEEHTSMQAIGYKELVEYLTGRESFESAVMKIKQKTRNYGKRQLTWFRNMGKVTWIKPNDLTSIFKIICN